MINSIATLRQEYMHRANIAEVDVQCGMDGAFSSELAIVGEAPGLSEVAKKLPLVGMSGQYLWEKLRKHGITRMQCYITNVCKRQITFADDAKRQSMNRHEKDVWVDLVLWELSQLPNLKYVLALGNVALEALCKVSAITKWRGSVLDCTLPNGRKIKVIVTNNPAMILREPKTEIMFLFDLAKLRRVMDGKHHATDFKITINPSFETAMEWIERLHGDAVTKGIPVAYDIESGSNETACIGFANCADTAICINWRNADGDHYTVVQERILRKRIQSFLGDTRVKLIAQNGMFDMTWLWFKDCIKPHANWFDTMLAHHTLYPTLPHNLGFITTQYTDNPYYKDEKDDWRDTGDIDAFWEYNGKDCCNTWAAAMRMHKELQDQQLDKFFFEHVMRLQPHLARMTVGGVKMDMALKEKIKQELMESVTGKLADFHAAVQRATGIDDYTPNPKSPAQLSKLFFSDLKLVGRGVKTDEANRKRMLNHPRTLQPAKDVILRLEEFTKDHKFLTTYADMQVDEDGRARCTYNQTGVQSAPGRLSSSKTLWGSGMNLQNQPSRAYPMFIADPDYRLVYFDMAQAEARLVAYFANIPLWKEQFERARRDGSYDAHRALAAEMFRIPYDEVPATDEDEHGNKTLRFISKRCRHGLNYRMQPERLAQTTGLPLGEATKAYAAYHRTTPELRKWWAELEKEVRATKKLYNAYGRRLFILERITDEALESIVAFKPQSTLGDHVCRVMYQSESDPKWPSRARLLLNVHDALISLVHKDDALRALSIMKGYAEQSILINGEPLIIPADCKISEADEQGYHRWSTLKKVKL